MAEHSAFNRLIRATLGNYQLEQLIEQSEAGPVFIGRNNAVGTLFRLRILVVSPNLTPEDRIVYLGHFQQEANQVASLQHMYILPLVDYGTHSAVGGQGQGKQGQGEQGQGGGDTGRRQAPPLLYTGGDDDLWRTPWPYLVSPYMPMRSLSAQLAKKGPMDVALASHYLDQVAAALEHAHQQAVLHRNLTTDCILIKQDGNLLVADFGVMRMLEIGARFSAPGARKGTYGMNEASAPAPEQILGQAADTYTDVYALGAVLYRMLTGHRVYRGKTREEILQQHLHAPIPSLTMWRGDLPKALDEVIARAMAKEPTQRFRQPGALANAYHEVVAPHDTKRVPFFVASTPAASGQPQKVYPGERNRNIVGAGLAPALNTPALNTPALNTPALNTPAQRRSPVPRIPNRSQPISRRRALTFIVAGGGTAAAAIIAVAVFGRSYLAGNTSPANTPVANATGTSSNRQGGQVLARSSDIPLNSAKTFPIAGNSNPGVIIHLPDGRFVAFDSTCTHAGCAVNYSSQDKLLECPCHQAAFDPAKNAAVVQGPANTPLAAIKITVNADGTITQG